MRLSAFTDEIFQPLEKAMDFIESNMAPMRDLELRRVAVGDMEPISIDEFEGENLKNLKELVYSRNFGVASVSSKFGKYKHSSWDDEEEWKEHQEVLKRCLDVSVELHAEYTRAFAFNRIEGCSFEDALPIIVERLGWAADLAADAGIPLALETEAGLYGDTGANARRIIDEVNSRYLVVNYDPGNSHVAGDVVWPDGFKAVKDNLEFMHVKSMRSPVGKKVDYYNIFREMKEMGFRGFISNEHHSRGGAPAALELHQDILRLFDRIY
jgi:sugar phosphate isomerase/epimerase